MIIDNRGFFMSAEGQVNRMKGPGMGSAERAIFTVGHSMHSLDAFIGLPKQYGIAAVAAVRLQPFSRLLEYTLELSGKSIL